MCVHVHVYVLVCVSWVCVCRISWNWSYTWLWIAWHAAGSRTWVPWMNNVYFLPLSHLSCSASNVFFSFHITPLPLLSLLMPLRQFLYILPTITGSCVHHSRAENNINLFHFRVEARAPFPPWSEAVVFQGSRKCRRKKKKTSDIRKLQTGALQALTSNCLQEVSWGEDSGLEICLFDA